MKKALTIALVFLFFIKGGCAFAESKYTVAAQSMIFLHVTDKDTVISNSDVCLDILKTIQDKAIYGASPFESRNNSIFITFQLNYLEKTMKDQLDYVPNSVIDGLVPGIHRAFALAKEAVADPVHPNYGQINQFVSSASKRIVEVKTVVQQ